MKVFCERLIVTLSVVTAISVLLIFIDSILVRIFTFFLIAALAGTALWEFSRLAKEKGVSLSSPVLAISGALVTLSFGVPLLPWVFLGVALIFFALRFNKIEGSLVSLSASFFGLIYIAIPLGMLLTLLYSSKVDGRFWVIYLLGVAKSADVAGYLGGTLWGRKKLAPQISPSKTVVGACCGLIASLCVSFFLSPFGGLQTAEGLGLGLAVGAISIFGDLSESVLKRDAKIKDSGTIPGLGGVLDLLDSLLLVIPLIYLYSIGSCLIIK